MPLISLETDISAPIERVFDLARSIDLHIATMSKHDEIAVGGVTKGLIGLGETVTWQATHFGIRQKLTSKITICDRPHRFQDVMVKGAFKCFTHDHLLKKTANGTLMQDIFDYESPFWFLGKIADALFLENYMTEMLTERNEVIKRAAESEEWKKFI
jgi:ligand-binding SRPBCC domain-containing protein